MADQEIQPNVPVRELISKIWSLFDRKDHRRLIGILALMLIGTMMDVLGVGLIVPVIAILSNPDSLKEVPMLGAIHQMLGSPATHTFLLWSLGGLLTVFVIKNVFLYAVYQIQNRFIYQKYAEIAGRLTSGYLLRPYTFHLQKNTAQLIRNISSELPRLVSSVLVPGLLLVSESLVFLGLFMLAIFFNPVATLIATAVLGTVLWLFYSFFRPSLAMWGRRVQEHSGGMIQQLQQGLGGIKEVKLYGRESHVTKNFVRHADIYTRNACRHLTLNQSSRLMVETLVIVVLLGTVMALVISSSQTSSILTTLALYAAIAFRLMPSANRLLTAATSIRFGTEALNVIHEDLKAIPVEQGDNKEKTKFLSFREAIELRNVTYTYEGAHQPVMECVNLRLEHGIMAGFHGESGAGKTTLVDLILGLIEPDEGKIFVDGQPIGSNLNGWQRQIGYVPQSIFLTDDTLRRNVAFGLEDKHIDDSRVWESIRLAQLDEFVKGKPDGLDTIVGERGIRLSGGQRQRIGIARALYHDPAVLVLDEATAALDSETEDGFIEVIRSLKDGKTILIISHRLSTLRHCHEQFQMNNGQITPVVAEAVES